MATEVDGASNIEEVDDAIQTIQVQIQTSEDHTEMVNAVVTTSEDMDTGQVGDAAVLGVQDNSAAGTSSYPVIMFKWGSEQKPFRCQICDMSFDDANKMCEHMAKHDDTYPQKPFPCTVCPKSFSSAKSLERHTLTHYCQTLKRCKYCYKVFVNRENLEKHIETHGGMKPHRCNECGEQFVYRQGLETHKLTHTGDRPFVCSICEKGFNRKDILERHMQVHNKNGKKYKCVECNKTFSHKFVLKRHARAIHSGEEEGAMCNVCNKFIRSKENLGRHMKIHTGDRPFQCGTCGRAFTQKQHLIDHSVLHTSDMPHKCDQCGMLFKHRRSLNRHLFKHKTCSFVCSQCPHAFSEEAELEKHLRKHQLFKHQCPNCYNLFKLNTSLQRHMWKCSEKQSERAGTSTVKECSEMATMTDDLHLYADIITEWEEKEEQRENVGGTEADVVQEVQEVVNVDGNHGNADGDNSCQDVVVILVDESSGEQVVLEGADLSMLGGQMTTTEAIQSLVEQVKQADNQASVSLSQPAESGVIAEDGHAVESAESQDADEKLVAVKISESGISDTAPERKSSTVSPAADMAVIHNYVKEVGKPENTQPRTKIVNVRVQKTTPATPKPVTLVRNVSSSVSPKPVMVKSVNKTATKPVVVPKVIAIPKAKPPPQLRQQKQDNMVVQKSPVNPQRSLGNQQQVRVLNVRKQTGMRSSLGGTAAQAKVGTKVPLARIEQPAMVVAREPPIAAESTIVYVQENAGRVIGDDNTGPVDIGHAQINNEGVVEVVKSEPLQDAVMSIEEVQREIIYVQDQQSMVAMETEVGAGEVYVTEGVDGTMSEGERNMLIQTVIEYAESLREAGETTS